MGDVADRPGDQQHPGSQPGPGQGAVTIHVATSVVQGPDGSPWVQLQIATSLTVFAVNVPADLAAQLAQAIPAKLGDALTAIRRLQLGLIVPGNGHGHEPDPSRLIVPGL